MRYGLAGAMGGAFFGPWRHNRVYAARSQRPITMGLLHSASGQYGVAGESEKRGSIMAIEEANTAGGVLGRKIDYVWADAATQPHQAADHARRFIVDNEVSFLSGAVHSSVATAVADVAQEFGCVYLNTNSSSPQQAGGDCRRVKFVFDANGFNFARATSRYVIERYGSRWLLLANDYEWGHRTAESIRAIATPLGAQFLDQILVPVGTRNYIGILKVISDIKPDVVATAIGGDDYVPLRAQAVDMGLNKNPAWLNNQQDWPDHFAIRQASLFGVFGTTWYHGLKLPGVEEFVQRYRRRWPDNLIPVPGNVFYNGYMAMRELINAIERAGTTNNIAVIRELEQLVVSASERMQHHDAFMNASTHHLQQTIYVASQNTQPRSKHDRYTVEHAAPPADVLQPDAGCAMESLQDTPVYEI